MKTEYFGSIEEVGFELASVSAALHAISLGMDIVDENENFLDAEDESGNPVTTDDIIERVQTAFKMGAKVFAVIEQPSDHIVIPARNTTLQSDFHVGQKVYMLHNNKIIKTKIRQIWISDRIGGETLRDIGAGVSDIASEIKNTTLNHATLKYIFNVIKKYSVLDGSMADVDAVKGMVSLSELFATKEELVEHLIEEV